jgi:hypothetical protein
MKSKKRALAAIRAALEHPDDAGYRSDAFNALSTLNSQLSTRGDRTCVHCGCTDSHACPGGCSWVEKHKATPTGVCSNCCSPSPGGEGRGEGGRFFIGKFSIYPTSPKKFWIQSTPGEGLQTTEAKLTAVIRKFFNREF